MQRLIDAILIAAVLRLVLHLIGVHLLIALHHVCWSTWLRVKFEHALRVMRQHFAQIARHRISPEEIMIECCVGIDATLWIELQ